MWDVITKFRIWVSNEILSFYMDVIIHQCDALIRAWVCLISVSKRVGGWWGLF